MLTTRAALYSVKLTKILISVQHDASLSATLLMCSFSEPGHWAGTPIIQMGSLKKYHRHFLTLCAKISN